MLNTENTTVKPMHSLTLHGASIVMFERKHFITSAPCVSWAFANLSDGPISVLADDQFWCHFRNVFRKKLERLTNKGKFQLPCKTD